MMNRRRIAEFYIFGAYNYIRQVTTRQKQRNYFVFEE